MLSDLPLNQTLCGDCSEVMKTFPDDCIDLVVTSPPYWGLRDYGSETVRVWGGLPECEHEWNEQVSSFNKQGGEGKQSTNLGTLRGKNQKSDFCSKCGAWRGSLGLEPHPQMFIDHLTEICYEVKRILKTTGSFWLNLGDTYAANRGYQVKQTKDSKDGNIHGGMRLPKNDAWLQPKQLIGIPWRVAIGLQEQGWILRNSVIWHKSNHMPESVQDRFTKSYEFFFFFAKNPQYHFNLDAVRVPHKYPETFGSRPELGKAGNGRYGVKAGERTGNPKGKNPGDMWNIPTKAFPGAHFAVFPDELIEPIIKASCPKDGVVLDPFAGSGTALRVSRKLGRKFIGIELNPEYAKMAEQRVRADKYSKPPDHVPKITDFRVNSNSGADITNKEGST